MVAATSAGPVYDANRLAVLYFDVLTQDSSLTPLAAGLTESLIHELGQVDALDVISRNGVGQFRGSNVSFDSIARTLSVGTLVQGSLARSGDLLRVNVSLVQQREHAGDEAAREHARGALRPPGLPGHGGLLLAASASGKGGGNP